MSDRGAQRACARLPAGALAVFSVDPQLAVYKRVAVALAAFTGDPTQSFISNQLRIRSFSRRVRFVCRRISSPRSAGSTRLTGNLYVPILIY
ncbi:hypothetical protein DVK07_07535 [Halorubrum sp. Atlit-26R]|nr:hypothetical protein DVK07_07535 [Halorubrum sp. Atlit-26R]